VRIGLAGVAADEFAAGAGFPQADSSKANRLKEITTTIRACFATYECSLANIAISFQVLFTAFTRK
jgi:hypothetical protein